MALMATVVISTVTLKEVSPSLSSKSCSVPFASLTVYAVVSHRMLTPEKQRHKHIGRMTLNTLLM